MVRLFSTIRSATRTRRCTSYVKAATVQNPPTVEPAKASCRRSRRAFGDGTAGVPLVRLEIMIRRAERESHAPHRKRLIQTRIYGIWVI